MGPTEPETKNDYAGEDQQQITRPGLTWRSPLPVVPKKVDSEGKKGWRSVIDFIKLNEKTIGHSRNFRPVRPIEIYISCIDMVMGYPDRDFGRWLFKNSIAPSTLQRIINVVLSGLTRSRCFVSLDDVVVYADIPPTGADESGYQNVSFGQSGLVQKTKSDY